MSSLSVSSDHLGFCCFHKPWIFPVTLVSLNSHCLWTPVLCASHLTPQDRCGAYQRPFCKGVCIWGQLKDSAATVLSHLLCGLIPFPPSQYPRPLPSRSVCQSAWSYFSRKDEKILPLFYPPWCNLPLTSPQRPQGARSPEQSNHCTQWTYQLSMNFCVVLSEPYQGTLLWVSRILG